MPAEPAPLSPSSATSPASAQVQTPTQHLPLLLWPGLAADQTLFDPVLSQLPDATVPAFIEPLPRESLRSYASRYAAHIQPLLPASGRYALGGFSFGGQLAMELAAVLEPAPLGLVLIVGVRGRHQILPTFRAQSRIGPMIPAGLARKLYAPFATRFARREALNAEQTRTLITMATANDPVFLNWSSKACAAWPGPPASLGNMPIRHIHGEHDTIIPDVRTQADCTLAGARHLITLTHPDEVAAFVRQSLVEFEDDAARTDAS